MSVDMIARFHDVSSTSQPAEWAGYHRQDADNALWSWRTVQAMTSAYRQPIVAVTLHAGDQVVGVAVLRLIGLTGRRPWASVAVISCPGAGVPGIRLLDSMPGIDPPDTYLSRYAGAVDAIEAALAERFPRRVFATLHRGIPPELLPAIQHGFTLTQRDGPSAMLNRGFENWEAYLATLAKGRRASIRNRLRRLDGSTEVRVEQHAGLPDRDLPAALDLINGTARRYSPEPRWWRPVRAWPASLITTLITDENTRVICYRGPDERLMAVSVTYELAGVTVHGQWGSRPPGEDGVPSGIWFDAMARVIRSSMDLDPRGTIGGKGLNEQKAEFGFDSVAQWSVLRPLSRR